MRHSALVSTSRELAIETPNGPVSALYLRPRGAHSLFVFAHGAGAGMHHPFMNDLAGALAELGTATLRYQFPYMEARKGGAKPPPNRAPVLEATVRAAIKRARPLARGIALIAGGKSMGGRMTSRAAAEKPLPGVAGIAFVGFPLHPPKRPEKASERAEHLSRVAVPMLFVQGTRDELAGLRRVRPLVRRLGDTAELHVVDKADHGFGVRVRDGRRRGDVISEIAGVVAAWAQRLC